MPVAPKSTMSSESRSPSSWRDILLEDARRPEDRCPDQITTLPHGRGWLDMALLVSATVALIAGLHFLAPGVSGPAQEAAATPATTRAN
jgi:hypothetical protein